jgi:hypothetical protein
MQDTAADICIFSYLISVSLEGVNYLGSLETFWMTIGREISAALGNWNVKISSQRQFLDTFLTNPEDPGQRYERVVLLIDEFSELLRAHDTIRNEFLRALRRVKQNTDMFALGCVNILAGLIWRQSAKNKRSVTTWREQEKNVLPTHDAGFSSRSTVSSFGDKNGDIGDDSLFISSSGKSGMGFGRQGEKAANMRGNLFFSTYHFVEFPYSFSFSGYIISPPMETLPRYIPPPSVAGEDSDLDGSSGSRSLAT